MRDMAFFEGVLHRPWPGKASALQSAFYYDLSQMWCLLGPLERIQELLRPPGCTRCAHSADRHGDHRRVSVRDCDAGPYNEVASPSRYPAPQAAGARRAAPFLFHGGRSSSGSCR